MIYSVQHIASVIQASGGPFSNRPVTRLLIDSRRLTDPKETLFFALPGHRRNGHQFIPELYDKGVRCFVVAGSFAIPSLPEAEFLVVSDTLAALQQLAAAHRSLFSIPVVGIAGSKGKTIVKEWLFQLLHEEFQIVRSPRSYNSQIGVPLSVWQMNEDHSLALFEAGISEPGEMEKLQKIIRPTVGILTNISEEFSESFSEKNHLFEETLKLFRQCKKIIGRENELLFQPELGNEFSGEIITWGFRQQNTYVLKSVKQKQSQTEIVLQFFGKDLVIEIPFTDNASVENAMHCFCLAHQMGLEASVIAARIARLEPVNMRLELKKGIHHCVLINDSYSSDLYSLDTALAFFDQHGGGLKKTIILSDLYHPRLSQENLYDAVAEKLKNYRISRCIMIGEKITSYLPERLNAAGILQQEAYLTTNDFTEAFLSTRFKEEAILIKGAKRFGFEKIIQLLEQKAHTTVLEINLTALVQNLRAFQKLLRPSTRIMAMVKAFAYGSGSAEIASILQYYNTDYLCVAYADEGVELRKSGIHIPIVVLNPDKNSFDKITEFQLEPALYSFSVLDAFEQYLFHEGISDYPVHIEIETGMHRLGFLPDEIPELASRFLRSQALRPVSVFSHLAAAEDPKEDEFTRRQCEIFQKATDELQRLTGRLFLRHLANSAAAIRHPELQYDMVRLGIGLYGIDTTGKDGPELQTVATLKSSIAQLRWVKAGESISYNRQTILQQDALIATIRLGYGDGFPRSLGNGKGYVIIRGKKAIVVGAVCMDMFMADVSHIPDVNEGDEVIIFGKELPVQELALLAGTIPYEMLTGISQRVRRIYYEE